MAKRIGILTGGGDCPGLNAVIRAAVKSAIGDHGFEVIGIEQGFEGLIHGHTFPLSYERIRGILPKGGTLLRTTNRGNPFEYEDGDTGEVADRSRAVLDHVAKLDLSGLVVIGGDGTLKIAQTFFELGLPVVAVPKTIDNDLAATDYTFGFMTAVGVATEAVDRLHSTAESHNRVMILEVMGRNAGWIALYAGIAGGADIILVPEIPYDAATIVHGIEERCSHGAEFAIVVVAEGAKRVGGDEVYADQRSKRLGGIAYQVAEDIQRNVDLEVRVTVLGHTQRGGSPVAFDRILATRFGTAAIDLIAKEQFGSMVALKEDEIVPVRIVDAIQRPKLVHPDSDIVRTARSLGIIFGDEGT